MQMSLQALLSLSELSFLVVKNLPAIEPHAPGRVPSFVPAQPQSKNETCPPGFRPLHDGIIKPKVPEKLDNLFHHH